MMRLLFCLLVACSTLSELNVFASASKTQVSLERFEFSRPEMGVPFRIILYAGDEDSATVAAQAAFDRIRQLNGIMSDYDSDSELSQLSRSSEQGNAVPVSPELWDILNRSQDLAKATGGAFDITIGPSVNVWRRARRLKQMPEPNLLTEALQRVGYQRMELDPTKKSVRLLIPNMRLDLGGIAKGYAVDEAMKVLKAKGITSALVGGDGDILVSAPPPGQPSWKVAMGTYDAPNALTNRFLLLSNAAVSTSGDLSQRLEIEGRRYSHIIDPRTGIGLTDHSMVTIIAKDSTTADSLATAISVLQPAAGMKLAKEQGVQVRIIRQPWDNIEVIESKGFQNYYEIEAK